jgi:hypothetical protein
MSVIVALIVFILIFTVRRNCLVYLLLIVFHVVLFVVILFLARGLCIPCVMVQIGVVLLLIVALFLIPPVIVLISVASCVLRCVTIKRSIDFGVQYERVNGGREEGGCLMEVLVVER